MQEALPTGPHLLRDSSTWPLWYTQLQFHALSKGIWDQINPDAPNAPNYYFAAPTLPTFTKDNNAKYQREIAEYRALKSS